MAIHYNERTNGALHRNQLREAEPLTPPDLIVIT